MTAILIGGTTQKAAQITTQKILDVIAKTAEAHHAEAIAKSIGTMAAKIGDLEFPDFTKAERTSIIDAMNSLKETLDEAIPRAVKNQKKSV